MFQPDMVWEVVLHQLLHVQCAINELFDKLDGPGPDLLDYAGIRVKKQVREQFIMIMLQHHFIGGFVVVSPNCTIRCMK